MTDTIVCHQVVGAEWSRKYTKIALHARCFIGRGRNDSSREMCQVESLISRIEAKFREIIQILLESWYKIQGSQRSLLDKTK